MLSEKKMEGETTSNCIKRLKHDITMHWYSRVGAMLTKLCKYHNIVEITKDISISEDDVPAMIEWDRGTLAEIINVLVEARHVARKLEAYLEAAMSRAPSFLRELCESLCVMSGDTVLTGMSFSDSPT